eukprot:Phypoly_transcript_12962.p1 GENE.Phypoly_transcript_12962~~Phypoly_transcript_12962.p1  ORF type:complete len:221 (-),score=1.70 Phypoly_transcript_12962:92-754(-)
MGLIACNTLIALTLFLMIKMKVDLEGEYKHYRWWFLAFALVFPLAVSLPVTFGWELKVQGASSCYVNNIFGRAILTFPSFVLLIIQIVLLYLALSYARNVSNAVQSHSDTQFPIKFLIVRFMATYCSQLFTILGSQIYGGIVPNSIQANAQFSQYAYVSHLTGGTIDAIILIIANVDFVHWVNVTVAKFRNRYSTNSQLSLSESSQAINPPHQTIEMTPA